MKGPWMNVWYSPDILYTRNLLIAGIRNDYIDVMMLVIMYWRRSPGRR
jgi:hypothetical protein